MTQFKYSKIEPEQGSLITYIQNLASDGPDQLKVFIITRRRIWAIKDRFASIEASI